ncbi:MAG: hypothetical protein PHH13_05235, partial [Candidatus Peribacteraceae bacterium]|nr:hypothetical protein [Candidatus Peribacteraceae bacterium]
MDPLTHPLTSVTSMKAFIGSLEGGMPVDISVRGVECIEQVLTAVRYESLPRVERGVVRRYLQVITGWSRAQVTRYIARHRAQTTVASPETPTQPPLVELPSQLPEQQGLPMRSAFVGAALMCIALFLQHAGTSSSNQWLAFLTGNRTDYQNVMALKDKLPKEFLTGSGVRLGSTSLVQTVIPFGNGLAKVSPLYAIRDEVKKTDTNHVVTSRILSTDPDLLRHRLTLESTVGSTAKTSDGFVFLGVVQQPTKDGKGAETLLRVPVNSPAHQVAMRAEERRQERMTARPESSPMYGAAPNTGVSEWAWAPNPTSGWDVYGRPTNMWDFVGPGTDGQYLTIANGKPVWKDFPSNLLGGGRLPVDLRGDERRFGGGGTGGGGGGGGGTTTDGGTVVVNAISGWTDDGTVVRLTSGGDSVAIGKNEAGAKLEVAGSISGTTLLLSGLRGCNTIDTTESGVLICGTDEGGIEIGDADNRYVNVSGDTMTGGLLIHVGGAASEAIEAGLALEVSGTMSGRTVHVQDQLSASGSLSVDGLTYLNGGLIVTGNESVTGNLAASGSLSVDGNSYLNSAVFIASTLLTGGNIGGSGALSITGTASFSNTVKLAGYDTCNLETDAYGNVVCGIDDVGPSGTGTGMSVAHADRRYVRASGDTMTGGLLIMSAGSLTIIPAVEAGVLLEVVGTASGLVLHAQDSLTSSGSLSVDGLTFLNNNTVVTGNFTATGNVAGSGTLSIDGLAYLNGGLIVTGNESVTGNLAASGSLSVD